MCLICVKNVATAVVRIYFELCCLIVGETFSQPTQLSGFVLFKWEGEGDVDYDMFAIIFKECTVERRHSGKDVSERHHPSRVELEPMPTWVVRMVTGRVLGSGWERERVLPLLDVCSRGC